MSGDNKTTTEDAAVIAVLCLCSLFLTLLCRAETLHPKRFKKEKDNFSNECWRVHTKRDLWDVGNVQAGWKETEIGNSRYPVCCAASL